MLFADLLSLHLVTFLMFFILVYIIIVNLLKCLSLDSVLSSVTPAKVHEHQSISSRPAKQAIRDHAESGPA